MRKLILLLLVISGAASAHEAKEIESGKLKIENHPGASANSHLSTINYQPFLQDDWWDTCAPPTIISATCDTTSITLTWTRHTPSWPYHSTSRWIVSYAVYSRASNTSGDMIVVDSNYTDTVCTLTNLEPGNTYRLIVRPACYPILYDDTVVSTHCTTPTLPYYEDFELFNQTCWHITRPNVTTTHHDGLTRYLLTGPDIRYALPLFDQPVTTTRISGLIREGTLVVGVMPSGSGDTVYIPIDTISPQPSQYWTHFLVSFQNYTGPDGRIAFWKGTGNTKIDNIQVTPIPACQEPFGITATRNALSTVTLHWSDHTGTQDYEVEYGLHGFAHGQGTTLRIFADSVRLTGLHHSTRYDLYMRTVCTGDTSEWSLPVTFTTLCGDIDTLPYIENFDQLDPSNQEHISRPPCWNYRYDYIDEYTILPNRPASNCLRVHNGGMYIILPHMPRGRIPIRNTRLQFTAWLSQSTAAAIITGVDNSTDYSHAFTPLDTIHLTHIPTRYETYFDTYTDTGEYITIKVERLSDYAYFEDVVIDYIPSCLYPDSVTATHVDSTAATVSWYPASTTALWQLTYGPQGFTPGTGDTVINSTTGICHLTGLQPGTNYDIYLRSICPSAGAVSLFDTSEWTINPLSVSTMQNPARIPYRCDFEDTAEALLWQTGSNMAYCWTYNAMPAELSRHGYRFDFVTGALNHTGNVPVNTVLYRDIDFGTAPATGYDSSTVITYRYKTEHTFNSLQLYVCLADPTLPLHHTDSRNTSPWGPVGNLHVIATPPHTRDSWTTDTIFFDTIHGIHRLVFFLTGGAYDNTSGTPLCIDNVQVVHPACPKPLNLAADSLSDTSALLSWHGDPAARYKVTCLAVNTRDTLAITAVTNQILITGLVPTTQYTVTVRQICSDSTFSSPSTPLQFTTPICHSLRSDTAMTCAMGSTDTSTILPVAWHDRCSYSQQIFDASYFSGHGTIQALSMNFGPVNSTSSRNESRIYLGHTSRSEFYTTDDFIDPSTLQLVYAGPMPATSGWHRIILNSPFEYDGESNLVLAILNNNNSYKAEYYHVCIHDRPLGIIVHRESSIDPTTAETLAADSSDVALTNCLSQAVFDFCPANPCPKVRLMRPNLRYSRVTLRWHSVDGGHSPATYKVKYLLNTRTIWDSAATTDTLLNIDNIYPDNEYLYCVSVDCPGNTRPNWVYGTFRTSPHDCAFPENMHITELTHKKASFRWTPDENNTTYTLHIFNTAFDTTVTSIIARASISGLPAGLTFHAAVQAKCSPDNHPGDWSDTITFSTPVCPEVTDLTYSDLQGNSVVLDWQCDPEVTQWEVQFGPIGFTQGYGITSYTDHHPYTLTGLTGETAYDIYVRSVCDDDWFSEHWSNPVTVTTPYSAIADPGSTLPLFTLSPNPATGSVTITVNSQFSIPNSQLSIVLRDATGRIRFSTFITTGTSEQPFSHTIRLHDYPAGIYFVTLVTPQGTTTRKLTIER